MQLFVFLRRQGALIIGIRGQGQSLGKLGRKEKTLLRLQSAHLPPPWLNQVFLCFPEPIVVGAVGDADASWISVRT